MTGLGVPIEQQGVGLWSDIYLGLCPRFSLEKQVFEGSREDFLISGGEVWEEESAIVGSLVFEDAIDGMEHLSSDSDQSLELCFVAAQQGLVEGPEMRIMA